MKIDETGPNDASAARRARLSEKLFAAIAALAALDRKAEDRRERSQKIAEEAEALKKEQRDAENRLEEAREAIWRLARDGANGVADPTNEVDPPSNVDPMPPAVRILGTLYGRIITHGLVALDMTRVKGVGFEFKNSGAMLAVIAVAVRDAQRWHIAVIEPPQVVATGDTFRTLPGLYP